MKLDDNDTNEACQRAEESLIFALFRFIFFVPMLVQAGLQFSNGYYIHGWYHQMDSPGPLKAHTVQCYAG